jgi:class 3 adenylate cyclase
LADRHGLEKIKTIGDAYMVVGGLPERSDGHELAVARMALDMMAVTKDVRDAEGGSFSLRIGIHTGPVVAGVIGTRKFAYDLWGDTVNVASRLEASSLPGRIQISGTMRDRLGNDFVLESRGTIELKGKGTLEAHFLVGTV